MDVTFVHQNGTVTRDVNLDFGTMGSEMLSQLREQLPDEFQNRLYSIDFTVTVYTAENK